jgi:Fic family protein
MLYSIDNLDEKELEVVEKIEEFRKKLEYSLRKPRRWGGFLRRTAFARAIQGSNTIEGYNVTAEDAIAAVEQEEPSEADRETWQAITGYRDAMTYILQLAKDPHFSFDENLIRSLHYMMLKYDLDKHPGTWRPGHIYVRRESTGEIVYEGPDSDMIPGLIGELVETMRSESSMPVMIEAALAHLNLVMIHPFSDGNGRMARALQTLVLARGGILDPVFSSIEEYLGRNTSDYYELLERTGKGEWNPGNDVKPWIRFCLTAHYRQATTLLRWSREYSRLWDELEQIVQSRNLHERMIMALFDAAMGYRVRNNSYRVAAEISLNLASRDLKALADMGLLIPIGEARGRYYSGSEEIKKIRQNLREPRIDEDPFSIEQTHLPGIDTR